MAVAGSWPALASCLILLVAPGVARGEEDVVSLQALRQQRLQGEVWCAEGDVKITYQDITLICDLVELDRATGVVKAEGNVLLDQGTTRIACSRLEFDLHKKVGTLYQVDAFLPPTYYFRGEELEKLDETHYRLHRGLFTSCQLTDGAPPWSMDVRDAIVELEGYGDFRGAAIKVRGVPIFYAPRFWWPVKRDRAFGLLVPSYGYNDLHGIYFGNSLYWPVSRSFDTTLFVDLYSKGYFGLGNEMRWAPAPNANGEILVETVRDKTTGKWQWKARGRHNQFFPGGYSLKAELQELSDVDFFQRWERTFDRAALRTLYSHITLSRSWGAQVFNLRTDHRRTFFTSSTPAQSSVVVLDRLPEIEYRLRSTRIGQTPLYLSMVATADSFYVDRSKELRGSYQRLDIFPSVSLLAPGFAWLNLTPTLGVRETTYSAQYSIDRSRLEKEQLSREYGTAGLSLVGPSFSRVWNLDSGDKWKHLIEPRIEYGYVSDPGDVSRIPVFDEKDSIQVTNRVRWTLANRLFTKSGQTASREVASLEVTQEHSFSELLTPERTGYQGSRDGPLSFWLRTMPVPAANLDARVDFDPVTANLTSTALTGGVRWGGSGVNLTWYSSRDPVSSKVTSSQTRVFLSLGPQGKPWQLEAQGAYDFPKSQLLEQRYRFRWRGSCWAATAELLDYRIAPYRRRDYRIYVDLTGLGTLLDIRGGLSSQ